jgi:superfamily I DNA/RNA helicase
VLARTNAELAPFAAIALEMNLAYRAAEDGLMLDDPSIDAHLDDVAQKFPELPVAVALARAGPPRRTASALLAWSAGAAAGPELQQRLVEARDRRRQLRRDDADLVLATAHGTKGLEFDHVACIGLDEGVFPSRRTLEDSDDPTRALEEERRLAYVAWTRARKSLTLVYDPAAPSVFLREAFSDRELGLHTTPAGSKAA